MEDHDEKGGVRLARTHDYPAARLIELPTHVPTGDAFMDSFDIAEQALGNEVQQGSLFAYLFRRFGYPNKGSDPDKELVAYMLTTTRTDMLLKIVPYAGGDVSISFTFLVPHDVRHLCDKWVSRDRDAHHAAFLDWIEAESRIPAWSAETADAMAAGEWPIPEGTTGWRRMMPGIAMISYFGVRDGDPPDKAEAIRWYQSVRSDYETAHPVPATQWRRDDVAAWEDADPMKPYAEAMAESLRDLLRPVSIRDTAIGIHGPIDEQDPEALGNTGPEAERAKAAGYPSGDLGNQDPKGFTSLHAAVLSLDPDPVTAIARAVELLAQAEATTATEPSPDQTTTGHGRAAQKTREMDTTVATLASPSELADALVSGETYNARAFRLREADVETPTPLVPTRLRVQHHKGRAVSVTPMDFDWADADPRQEAWVKDEVLILVAEDYQLEIEIASIRR